MQRTIISSFATLTLLSGCGAGVNVARFDGTPAAMRGVPYNLPMTAFKITITRTVTKCGAQLEGDIQATVETTRKIDPGQMYTLSSHGFWNTSDIKGTYATDGTTTGLNATSEGQAGQALSDIVSTIATIAPLIAAVGGAGDACQPEIVTAVAEVNGPAGPGAPPGLRKTVETETKELETLTNNLTVLTAQATALGSAITPQNQTDFWTAIQAVFAKKASLAATRHSSTRISN